MKLYLFAFAHFLSIVLILKFISFILPNNVLNFYIFACNASFCVIVAYLTFFIMKRKLLSAKVKASGKAVFITGCDSGFGNFLAKRLDSLGFHVFAGCFFPSGIGATDLRKSCSKRMHVLQLDVTDSESVRCAAQLTKEKLGSSVKLWAIVNNAGIQKGFTTELTPLEDFQDVLDVNTFGHIRVCKAFLPLLRASKGRIVNITSVAGRFPHAHMSPYCVSKYASQAFNECLRMELLFFGVDVISIEPQAFESAITNPDRIRKAFDVMLESVDKDVLSYYKEKKYISQLRILQNFFTQTTSPKTHLVIDDLENAITSVYPNSCYQTRGSWVILVFMKTMELLPTFGQDVLYRLMEAFAPVINALGSTCSSAKNKDDDWLSDPLCM